MNALSVEQLRDRWDAAVKTLSDARDALAAVNDELRHRFQEEFELAFTEAGKQDGSVSRLIGGAKVTCTVKKTVTWDAQRLTDIGNAMSPDDASKIFKVEVSVPEKIFSSLPPSLSNLLAAARTVKYSEPKIEFAK